jgi:hypothetical protein
MKNKIIVFLMCLFVSFTAYAESLPRILSITQSNLSSLNITSSCLSFAGTTNTYVKRSYPIGSANLNGAWCETKVLNIIQFTTMAGYTHQVLFRDTLTPQWRNGNWIIGPSWYGVTPPFVGDGKTNTVKLGDLLGQGFYKIVVFDVDTNILVPDGLAYMNEASQPASRMASQSLILSEDFQSKLKADKTKSYIFKAPMFIFPTAELRKRRMI